MKLWRTRENEHTQKSNNAWWWFFGLAAVSIAVGVVVPLHFGGYIAASFVETVCAVPASEAVAATATSPAIPARPAEGCERVFSPRGPVTVAGLFLAASLLLWLTRLQYRIHLSERHLALDASEKKAFAETYLAMKEGRHVGDENEAIILASLFRPTQDGIIKDDESGLDVSAVTLLARQMSKPN